MSTEEVRRLARRCRRLGLRAQYLGNCSDSQWSAVRHYIDADDVTDLELADAVDWLIRCEEGLADCEQIVDVESALDLYGTVG